MANIALQLYTVRDVADKQGYEKTIRQVADIGYRFVETAGFPGVTPEQAAKLFKALGLTVAAAHIANPVGDQKNQVLDTMETLGKPRLVVPSADRNLMQTDDGVKQMCDFLNEGARNAQERGIQFGYHNHWLEYHRTESGQYVYKLMQKYLLPQAFFELDLYWIKFAGVDPAEIVKELGKRAPLLHVKDGPANDSAAPMTAVGEGTLDWQRILGAGKDTAEFWIVEMDRVAGSSMEEAKKSFNYLKNLKI